jgi:sulfate/thiosulfate transport system permease protein
LPRLTPVAGRLLARSSVVAYTAVLVIVPLAALARYGLAGGLAFVVATVTEPVAWDAIKLTLWTAAVMALLNGVMGTATAWVLVRYRFPGRGVVSALVDLPFAVPTLVAGILIVLLFGPQTTLGGWFGQRGVHIVFASPGIVLALLFVTFPLVVRGVEPVLKEIDPAEEEAAHTLGAGHFVTFLRVVLPALAPAMLAGTLQSFARAMGEFGTMAVVAGNIPHQTLTVPVFIFGQIESGSPEVASAMSVVMLAIALALEPTSRLLARGLGIRHV